MENSNNAPTGAQQQEEVFKQASLLYGVFFNNEKYVEALHTMFLAYVLEMDQEEQEKDQVVNAYQNLRHFLRDTDVLFNHKNENHA